MEARTERNDSFVPLTHYRICRGPTKIVPSCKNFDHQRAKTYTFLSQLSLKPSISSHSKPHTWEHDKFQDNEAAAKRSLKSKMKMLEQEVKYSTLVRVFFNS